MPNTNNRVFYAVHAVGIRAIGNDRKYRAISGVQSVGINTTFNLEQVFQLGQLDLYDNIEDIPDVEVTIEKVLDGRGLVQHLATDNSATSGLSSRYGNARSDIAVVYYVDTKVASTGNDALAEVVCSGMYLNSINFNMSVDGNFTESVTFVGNDKFWATGTNITSTGTFENLAGTELFRFEPSGTSFFNNGSPNTNIFRRQHLVQNVVGLNTSLFPKEIPGVSLLGLIDIEGGGAKVQTVTVSVDLGRSELFALGQKGPYHRFAEFPTEITCSIEVIEPEFGDAIDSDSTKDNLTNERISFYISDGLSQETRINLGSKNKLSSVTSSGGDAGGGNRITTYNYSNFNFLIVSDSEDPPNPYLGNV